MECVKGIARIFRFFTPGAGGSGLFERLAVTSRRSTKKRPAPGPHPARQNCSRHQIKEAHPLFRAHILLPLLIFFSLISGFAQAQHAPVIFYNVPNWYSGGWEQIRFQTPQDAFDSEWNAQSPICDAGGQAYQLNTVYPVDVGGYEPGTFYNATYYLLCYGYQGPYVYGSSARRWAVCANIDVYGNTENAAGYSADEFANSLCPKSTIDPDKSRGVPGCLCLKGDPVNPGTGNKFEWLEIYRGAGAFPLNFAIAYNSQNGNSSIQAPSDLVLGARRVHSYLRMIRLNNNSVTATAYALRPDGKVLGFNQSGTSWVADADIGDTLEASYATDGSISGWTYTTGNGDQELYNNIGQLLALTTKGGITQSLLYNANGTLASVTDPEGRVLTFWYDANGRISSVQDPNGSAYVFSYDTSNNLKTITYPDSNVLTLVYGENSAGANDLTGVIDENSNRTDTTQYDSNDRATSTSGPNGIGQTTFGYNFNSGSLIGTVTDSLGKVETFTTEYLLGSVRPLKTTQACTSCTAVSKQYTYDTNGYLASSSDYNGNVTKTSYDANGLLDQEIEASGGTSQRSTNFTWNTTLRLPLARTVLNASGTVVSNTQWVYNTTGQTLARCDIDPSSSAASGYACSNAGTTPVGVHRWTYSYCSAVDATQCPLVGLLLTATGPRTDLAQTATYSYYLSASAVNCGTPGAACYQPGDLKSVTDALGHVTTIASYDADGRVTRITDANGINADSTYDPRGWLATRTVGGATTTFGYTPYGAVASITDPDGVVVSYTYDAAHRLTRVTDALGNYVQYTLDAAGNKTAEQVFDSSGALHKSLSRAYNTLGQLTQVTDGLSHAVFNAGYSDSYDANGNLVHTADALGVQRKQGYDGLNRLVQTLDDYNGTNTATQNAQSVFAYDANDRLQGVGDPDGLNTAYSYDGLGNATVVQSPDTGTTTYVYDAAGNVIQRTDANGVTSSSTSSYDALNRRIATTYTDSTLNVAYTYDEPSSATGCASSYPVGRLTRLIETNVTTVYCYDQRGNVTQKSQTQGTATDVTSYSYTSADRLASTLTAAGTSIQYSRDANGHISGVTVLPPGSSGAGTGNVVTAVSYLPFGPIASYTLGNGQTITRTYDANYALTDISSPALNLHFARDAMGDITALGSVSGANPATETYSYDPLYRLTGLYNASGTAEEIYTYSKAGDRLSKTSTGLDSGTYSYQSGTHHLASIGNASRVYDLNGNTTGSVAGGNTYGFGYNGRSRITVAQLNGSTVGTYTYNALGQRTAKVATFPAATSQRFVYDESSQLLSEYGSDTRDYIWLGNLPVATVDTSGTAISVSYVHADASSTPRVVTDAGGNTIWQLGYQGNPFGEQPPASSSGYTLNMRFPGQYYDVESGLMQNVSRDYEAATGRYIQSDPIGLAGGWNSYGYVGGNPLSGTDPLGRSCAQSNGFLSCSYPGGPAFTLPAQPGYPALLGPGDGHDDFYHAYDVTRDVGCADDSSVMQGIINNPTPGTAFPATPNGTSNNAVVPFVAPSNPVTSYLTTDTNTGAPLVVNVTGPNSAFGPGYVARTVTNGVAHTYGEGEAFIQGDQGMSGYNPLMALGNWAGNQLVWGSQMNSIIGNAKRKCGCKQ